MWATAAVTANCTGDGDDEEYAECIELPIGTGDGDDDGEDDDDDDILSAA